MVKVIGFSELETAEDLKLVVATEARRLATKATREGLEAKDMVMLEKTTKAYTLLMADLREMQKSGLLKDLNVEDLEKLAEKTGKLDEGKKGARRGRKPARQHKEKLQDADGDDEVGNEGL